MSADDKAKLLRDAEKYISQGKVSQAITEYLKVIKFEPNDVLTLNIVGDLCLRQGKIEKANKFFAQVAESYAKNNFLLKAIAVYKKILTIDPENLEINNTLASLLAKQGMNVDARNQYLRVAEMLGKEDRKQDSLEAYEKAVSLDWRDFASQLKLAEIYLSEGDEDRAHSFFVGAARAQTKAGIYDAALDSYRRALEIKPSETETLKGFLEASTEAGDVSEVIERCNELLGNAPNDSELFEILGQSYLAAKDFENAERALQTVISMDNARYANFIGLSNALVYAGDCDRATRCLDPVLPILISRRETQSLVEAYDRILQSEPGHVLCLMKLAEIYSATNDQIRYLEVLDRLASSHLAAQAPEAALEYFEQILQIEPNSQRHLNLHRQAFTEAHPDELYTLPTNVAESRGESPPEEPAEESVSIGSDARQMENSKLVEVDLLLTYDMKEKALAQLLAMEAQDPMDKEVRSRLFSFYQDSKEFDKAAEQCMALAALHRRARNEDAAERLLSEAKKLAPELFGSEDFDLVEFALQHGISMETDPHPPETVGSLEVDLSGDLSEIFFTDAADPTFPEEGDEIHPVPEAGPEEYAPPPDVKQPADSVQEQLQEVDFYVRLGFFEEARTKLDEIASEFPDHPELTSRYEKLDEGRSESSPATIALGPGENDRETAVEAPPPVSKRDNVYEIGNHVAAEQLRESSSVATGFQTDDATVPVSGGHPVKSTAEQPVESQEGTDGASKVNAMFADLIEEVNSLTDQKVTREDFETHFSLGIAYREMDLIEDAIKEFQGAIKALNPSESPREVIQCCGMLTTCFIDKGIPRTAIRWCQTGLLVPDVTSHEALALRYDMGIAHALNGEPEQALECFTFIHSIDPSYRDVAHRLNALKGVF